MTPQDARQLVELIVRDRSLAAELWEALIADPDNVRALVEALQQAVKDSRP